MQVMCGFVDGMHLALAGTVTEHTGGLHRGASGDRGEAWLTLCFVESTPSLANQL